MIPTRTSAIRTARSPGAEAETLAMTSEPIQQVLATLHDDGHIDSSGRFTMDPRKAAEKYRTIVDQQPALGLLKMVQAAVALRSGGIEVRLPRTGWEASFCLPALSAGLLQALHYPGLASGLTDGKLRAWAHLRVAWEAALASRADVVSLEVWSRDMRLRWSFADGDFTARLSEESSNDAGAQLTVQDSSRSWWHLWSNRNFHLDLQAGLTSRCAFCPVPIRLDSRVINPIWPPAPTLPHYPFKASIREAGDFGQFGQLFALVERWWLEPRLQAPRLLVPSPASCNPCEVAVMTTPSTSKPQRASMRRSVREHIQAAVLQIGGENDSVALQSDQCFYCGPGGRLIVGENDGPSLQIEELPCPGAGRALELLQFGQGQIVPKLLKSMLHSDVFDVIVRHPIEIPQNPEPDWFLELPRAAQSETVLDQRTGDDSTLVNNVRFTLPKRSRPLHGLYLSKMVWLPPQPSGQSYLYGVIDGVLTDPRSVQLGAPGFVAVVASTDFNTDLSQLGLIDDQAVAAAVASIAPAELKEMLKDAIDWAQTSRAKAYLPEPIRDQLIRLSESDGESTSRRKRRGKK